LLCRLDGARVLQLVLQSVEDGAFDVVEIYASPIVTIASLPCP
jgi:hypothetical protein